MQFDFVSPHSIEACASLLTENFASHKPNVIVTIHQIDMDMLHFTLRTDAGRNLITEVVGTLKRVDQQTVVSGESQIDHFVKMFLGIWLSIWIIGWFIVGIYIVALIGLGMLLAFYLKMQRMGKRLIKEMHDILG